MNESSSSGNDIVKLQSQPWKGYTRETKREVIDMHKEDFHKMFKDATYKPLNR